MPDDPLQSTGRFVTLADVAELLSISTHEVLVLVRSGELPAIRVGSIGQWRVETSVVESFIADKYDEARRLALWNEAEFADVAEVFPQQHGTDHRRTSST